MNDWTLSDLQLLAGRIIAENTEPRKTFREYCADHDLPMSDGAFEIARAIIFHKLEGGE